MIQQSPTPHRFRIAGPTIRNPLQAAKQRRCGSSNPPTPPRFRVAGPTIRNPLQAAKQRRCGYKPSSHIPHRFRVAGPTIRNPQTINPMSATVIIYHIVFRPKNSRPVIDIAHEECLYRYIWRYVTEKKGFLHAVGGMPDHIHMLVELPANIAVADFVRDLKTSTSKFLTYNHSLFPYFERWARGYFCETHSLSQKNVIKQYIKGQKAHHTKLSFKDELKNIYIQCGLPIDQYFLPDE